MENNVFLWIFDILILNITEITENMYRENSL